jgi:hypothetical protein
VTEQWVPGREGRATVGAGQHGGAAAQPPRRAWPPVFEAVLASGQNEAQGRRTPPNQTRASQPGEFGAGGAQPKKIKKKDPGLTGSAPLGMTVWFNLMLEVWVGRPAGWVWQQATGL